MLHFDISLNYLYFHLRAQKDEKAETPLVIIWEKNFQ